MAAAIDNTLTFSHSFPNLNLEKKEANSNLYLELFNIQKEIQNPKNTAYNPYFESNYTALPELLKLLKPMLNERGILLIQDTGGENGKVFVQTSFIHVESGEILTLNKLWMKPQKLNPQGGGSAITYARRYQLTAFFAIMGEDDDDGNAASTGPKRVNETAPDNKAKLAPKSAGKPAPKSASTQSNSKPAPKSAGKNTPKSGAGKSTPPTDLKGDAYWEHLATENPVLKKVIDYLKKEKFDICKVNILEGSADLIPEVLDSEERGAFMKYMEDKEDRK